MKRVGEESNLVVHVEANIDPEGLILATRDFVEDIVETLEKYDISEKDSNKISDNIAEFIQKLEGAVVTRVVRNPF